MPTNNLTLRQVPKYFGTRVKILAKRHFLGCIPFDQSKSGLSKSEKSLAKRNATLTRAARQPEVVFLHS